MLYKKFGLLLAVGSLAAPWSSASAVTGAYYQIEDMRFPGSKVPYIYPDHNTFTARRLFAGTSPYLLVRVTSPDNSATYIDATFGAPHMDQGVELTAGTHAEAHRGADPRYPTIDVAFANIGCNRTEFGWFDLRELEYSGDTATKLAVDFRYQCEGSPEVHYGSVRINSDLPVMRPEPVAVTGTDRGRSEVEPLVLESFFSFSDKGPLTYQWDQVDGPPATIADPTAPYTTFTPEDVPLEGATYEFRLTVTDTDGLTDTDTVRIAVTSKSQPQSFAYLGPAGFASNEPLLFALPWDPLTTTDTVNYGAYGLFAHFYQGYTPRRVDGFLTLKGPGDEPMQAGQTYASVSNYSQTEEPQGLNNLFLTEYGGAPEGIKCDTLGQFTVDQIAYDAAGKVTSGVFHYRYNCTGATDDDAFVYLNAYLPGVPIASAGPDAAATTGDAVGLDASASFDPFENPLTFSWEQVSGPAMILDDPASATPHFVASAAGTAVFSVLVVTADNYKARDEVTINIAQGNRAPVAAAGTDLAVTVGAPVTLSGSGSSDPDGDFVSYSWEQLGGPAVSLTGADTPTAQFTAPETATPVTLTFRLTVRDPDDLASADEVSVTVSPPSTPDGGGGGGAMSPILLALLALRRRAGVTGRDLR